MTGPGDAQFCPVCLPCVGMAVFLPASTALPWILRAIGRARRVSVSPVGPVPYGGVVELAFFLLDG